MTVFQDDFIGKRIKKNGLYEKPTLEFVRGYLSDRIEPVIADVGANIGNHSLDFSTYASRVYSFEPVGETFGLLKKNIEENNIDNVIPVNRALSDEPGVSEIFIIPRNAGASSFEERYPGSEKLEVVKIVGDSFFAEQDIDRLDFIKVDVEGHEEQTLRGLMKTIRKFQPTIMMEWRDLEAIKKINESRFLEELKPHYNIMVLGSKREKSYWKGKFIGSLRRKLAKIFLQDKAIMYPFDAREQYRNILLIPKSSLR